MDITSKHNAAPFTVALLLTDGFALMSYAAAVEPLRAANLLSGKSLYNITHTTADGSAARSSSGALIDCDQIFKPSLKADLVLVIAGGDPARYDNFRVFNALKQLNNRGVTLGAVSGGPVILARAGVMQARRFTVHWEHAPVLNEMDPGLLVERSLYVIDRDRVTCAGGTAPLDLMHALITSHHGAEFAREVSDWFMHTEVRPSFGPQRSGLVERYKTHNGTIVQTIEIMENHIGDVLDLGQLALLSDVSKRQLNRLFHDTFQKSTMTFYQELRLEKAQTLIKQTTLPLTEIALLTGFANSSHFSKCYKARFGASPSSVRRVTVM